MRAMAGWRGLRLRVVDALASIGSTKTQTDELNADTIAFVFWRVGLPQWRPRLDAVSKVARK